MCCVNTDSAGCEAWGVQLMCAFQLDIGACQSLTFCRRSAAACQKDSKAGWSLPNIPPSAFTDFCAYTAASPAASPQEVSPQGSQLTGKSVPKTVSPQGCWSPESRSTGRSVPNKKVSSRRVCPHSHQSLTAKLACCSTMWVSRAGQGH